MAEAKPIPGHEKFSASIKEDGKVEVFNGKNEAVKEGKNGFRVENAQGKRVSLTGDQIKEYFINPPAVPEQVATPAEGAQPAETVKAVKRKLTEEDAVKIMERINNKEKLSVIAKDYGVHQSTISDIKVGRLYPKAGGKPIVKPEPTAQAGEGQADGAGTGENGQQQPGAGVEANPPAVEIPAVEAPAAEGPVESFE